MSQLPPKPLSAQDNLSWIDEEHDRNWEYRGVKFVEHIIKNKATKKTYKLYERVDPPEFYDISNMTYE